MAFTTVQAYQRELNELIGIEIERLKEIMANGHLNSYEDYKNLAGKIAGLKSSIELMNEADRLLSEKYR